MVAVFLLACIALSGASVRMLIDGIVDTCKPMKQRVHHSKNPRLLIWGATGFLFSGVMLVIGFPLAIAIALWGLGSASGIVTSILGRFKILSF
jgi:hypothetical protein